MDAESSLLVNDGRARGRSDNKASLLLGLVVIAIAICIAAMQVFIIVNVKRNQDLLDDAESQPGKPVNLAVSKAHIVAYYSSGQYDDDLARLTSMWWGYFNSTAAKPKDTVVFDIDDTILSNYPEMSRNDFGFIPKLWDAWVVSGNASAIPQTRQFYQSLIAHGYTIVFLTGRNDYVANATISNLHDQGFNTYETLITRDPVEYHLTAYNYKSARRAQLAKMGYNIVGSIGDQLSDVNGDFAGYRMKVPNYCYFIA